MSERRPPRWVVLAAGAAMGVAMMVAVVLVLMSKGVHRPAAATVLPEADRQRLETALASQDRRVFLAALSEGIRDAAASKPPLLPAGSKVTIDAHSFTARGTDLGTVIATVSGPEPGRWQLDLVREHGRWTVFTTERLR